MSGRDVFKKNRKIIMFLSFLMSKKSLKKRYKIFEKYNKNNSKLSVLMRYLIIKATAKKCGDNVYIGKNTVFKNIESMSFGNNVSVHEFCYIDGGQCLNIGDNVSVAHGCSIIAVNHSFLPTEVPFKYQNNQYKNIVIGNNVWIGSHSVVLAGATICDNVVIAAGTVCTSKQILDSWHLYAGNPASMKKSLK